MIRIIALGSIYMLMLFALAAGVQSLAGGSCSDWLADCPATETNRPTAPTLEERRHIPDNAKNQ